MESHKHTNRLINETSPYLLQHAHNPVDWFAWGEEAFDEAKRLNKPILLSIGYSACHWCHVMEHESFEDESIAQLMNEKFVNIKVDREERPDLDNIYMTAVQMLTGQGGWPMTMFLTPEGLPFFGGTYYPPEDRYNMPGFRRVLTGISEAFHQKPDDVSQTANSIVAQLKKTSDSRLSTETLSADILDDALRSIVKSYDYVNGGFGGAPKFPAPMSLDFLLRSFHRTGAAVSLDITERTCRKMAAGGIYDQLGGGFHRYSTDAKWLVPHFEKMLYDNAQLIPVYLHVYQITGNESFKSIAIETLDYVHREMTDSLGGFYSTQDADSEGHEGKFFVWSEAEIRELLSKSDADIFINYFGVTGRGNFEGTNILNITDSIESLGTELDVPTTEVIASISRSREILFNARELRIKPFRDEKLLTAWNGLMIAAFAEGAAILDDPSYLETAVKAADFCLRSLRHEGLLLRTFKDGKAKLNAYLEDYSFLASGLLTLYEVSGDRRWLDACIEIVDTMIAEFWDNEQGGFFFTGTSHETLIVRSKDYQDNATPSGNSVATEVIVRLAALTGNDDYRRRAVTSFRLLLDSVRRYPSAFGRLLCALDFYLSTPREIAIAGDPQLSSTRSLTREVWKKYLPNKIIAQYDGFDQSATAGIPLLEGRGLIDGRPAVYVCENFTCKLPVTDPLELREQLGP